MAKRRARETETSGVMKVTCWMEASDQKGRGLAPTSLSNRDAEKLPSFPCFGDVSQSDEVVGAG